jgi:hypothetical protein
MGDEILFPLFFFSFSSKSLYFALYGNGSTTCDFSLSNFDRNCASRSNSEIAFAGGSYTCIGFEGLRIKRR